MDIDDIFHVLTHDLVLTGADDKDELPEVDELFSQVLLPPDFDFELHHNHLPSSAVQQETRQKELGVQTESQPSRFGPLVSKSDIAE